MRAFQQCMKDNGGIERMCKAETRAYMQCRMDRCVCCICSYGWLIFSHASDLMAKDSMDNLGLAARASDKL